MKLTIERLEDRNAPVVGAIANAPLVPRGGFYDGVVLTETGGTGGLIATSNGQGFGHHILTAAHAAMVSSSKTANAPMNVYFHLTRSGMDVDIPIAIPGGTSYQILHPSYATDTNYDVAVLKLVDQDAATQTPTRLLVAPFAATQYRLHAPNVDISGKRIDFAGYGMTGTGATGQIAGTEGKKRSGSNEADGGGWPGPFIVYDFDDGTAANNKSGGTGLGNELEAIQVSGDSGSPAFLNENKEVIGVHVATSKVVGQPNGRFGDHAYLVRVGAFLNDLIAPTIDNAGAYDLVLDMKQQVFGASDAPPPPGHVGPMPPDELTITAKNVNGNLELWVANDNDPNDKLNGRYYSAPAAYIKSLTIRGTYDHETIIIDGPLGLGGDKTITIIGREGDDTIRINRIDGPGANDYHGTIKVDGGTGDNKLYVDDTLSTTNNTYTITATSVTRTGRPSIEYAAISTLGLTAGSGSDIVNLDGVAGTLKLELAGGPGRDKLVMIAGHANDPTLTGFEDLVISGGKLTLNTSALGVETMSQSGGTLEGTADVTTSVSLSWSGGTMQGTGKAVSLNTSTTALSGATTLTRTLENQGIGNWNGATIGGGTGTLRNTGYLSGTGTLAGTLVNDGALLPGGAGAVGTITVQGAFSSAGTLAADLGATADLVAAQTVTLGGTFSPTAVAGFPAKSYTVVDNTGANPVNGTFAGLPEGAVLTVNGVRYQITYVGGTGNDVVLHAVVNIGDRVWEDFNLDGIQNEGTPNLPPMTVELFTPSDVLVAQTMTSATGEYLFPNVRVGDYYLKFGLPGDGWYKFTRKDWTADALDSDAEPTIGTIGKTAVFALSPGQDDLTRDAGVYKLGTVGDLVWLDYYIGGDGIQQTPPDGGPISGLTVTLVSTPSGYGGVTTSDSYGYLFEKVELVDANWNPISYRVQFTKPPNGGYSKYAFSPMDQGTNDELDSDADPATGLTGSFTLPTSGAVNRTIDCGIQYSQFSGGGFFAAPDQGSEGYPDGLAVRGRVWEDGDGDGVRDPSEPAVAKWRVGLYTAGGELVAETRTGADGAYEFAGVAAGLYRVRFDPPGAGQAFTLRDQGTDDALDSDADPDGYSPYFANVNPGPWAAAVDAGLVRTGGRLRSMPLPAGRTSGPEVTTATAGEPASAIESRPGELAGADYPAEPEEPVGTLAPRWVGIDPFGLWGGDREDDPLSLELAAFDSVYIG